MRPAFPAAPQPPGQPSLARPILDYRPKRSDRSLSLIASSAGPCTAGARPHQAGADPRDPIPPPPLRKKPRVSPHQPSSNYAV